MWQANKSREEIEEQFNSSGAPGGASGPDDTQLRDKICEIRDLKAQIDVYKGKAPAINALSKTDLTELLEELNQSRFSVTVALQNK